ncbi:hypothetical protein D3C73_1124930 [compost metagenome]
MTSPDDAVRSENTEFRIRDMHRAAFALTVSGLFTEQLRHHQLQITAFRHDMTVTAVRTGYKIVVP